MTLSEKLIASWQSPIVARSEVGRFSGGILHPRTMANLDAKGEGPGKIVVGGKVGYYTEVLARWTEGRATGQGVRA
jgi:hypothetical protein